MLVPSSIVLLKLGGSLITEKARDRRARPAVIARLAREIVAATRDPASRLILGHGSGSFGHRVAQAFRVQEGIRDARGLEGVSKTQQAARALHALMIEALAKAGATPFSFPPSSFILAREGRPWRVFVEPVLEAFDRGLLPVVGGDVVMDRTRGATILSTETVLEILARALVRRGRPVARALWLGDTEGVYAGDGTTITQITPAEFDAHRGHLRGATTPDVTGGMLHRVESCMRLARLGIESLVIDGMVPGRLARALRGQPVRGTRILASATAVAGNGG